MMRSRQALRRLGRALEAMTSSSVSIPVTASTESGSRRDGTGKKAWVTVPNILAMIGL